MRIERRVRTGPEPFDPRGTAGLVLVANLAPNEELPWWTFELAGAFFEVVSGHLMRYDRGPGFPGVPTTERIGPGDRIWIEPPDSQLAVWDRPRVVAIRAALVARVTAADEPA